MGDAYCGSGFQEGPCYSSSGSGGDGFLVSSVVMDVVSWIIKVNGSSGHYMEIRTYKTSKVPTVVCQPTLQCLS